MPFRLPAILHNQHHKSRNMKKTARILTFIITLILVQSCALKPVPSQYNYIKLDKESSKLDKLGNGLILIYNGADGLHKIDNTARLNVWIDDIALEQVRGNEYVIINLKEGNYNFKLLHIDMFNMRSTHPVIVDKNTKVIRIEPTITSNKLTITNDLPTNFDNFEFVAFRK